MGWKGKTDFAGARLHKAKPRKMGGSLFGGEKGKALGPHWCRVSGAENCIRDGCGGHAGETDGGGLDSRQPGPPPGGNAIMLLCCYAILAAY